MPIVANWHFFFYQCTMLPEVKDDLGGRCGIVVVFPFKLKLFNVGEIAKEVDLNELQHLMSDMAQQMLGAYQVRYDVFLSF